MELPISKIKKIAKFDPDVKLISQEGAVALTLSCEMFIKSLAENVYQQTVLGKRKTVQMRDVDACLQNTGSFSFLEGALETWTDVAGQPGSNSRSKGSKEKTTDDDVVLDEGNNESIEDELRTDNTGDDEEREIAIIHDENKPNGGGIDDNSSTGDRNADEPMDEARIKESISAADKRIETGTVEEDGDLPAKDLVEECGHDQADTN